MIIDSGKFQMESRREFKSKYSQTSKTEQGDAGALSGNSAGKDIGNMGFLAQLAYATYGESAKDIMTGKSISELSAPDEASAAEKTKQLGQGLSTIDSMYEKIQRESLNFLFRLFFGGQSMFRNSIWGSNFNLGIRYQSFTFTESYEETENTSFETTGTVKTADGREINFNLNVEMSRSFYEENNLTFLKASNPMIDPLVINLDGNVDTVSDQTFFFDLDADGVEEEISSLNQGAGFLAFDKNGDGEINDGSELFGALSGDGFAELAEYDLDGNGWIDEADEIFDKLRVWSQDASGNMRLFTLKESDVGAICLTSAPTQFSVNDENNDTHAMVRKTGFFLKESSGMAGAVQQIDLAAM